MLEWTLVSLVDDVNVRLVAGPKGLNAIQFRPEEIPAEGERNDANPVIGEARRHREEVDKAADSAEVRRAS